MPKLNLETKNKAQELIKAYLEENASDLLADKINNGVRVQKDGKKLLNKKTLAGFMKFACDEAKKQAEKGAHSACIDDAVVYGWAIHYFEEDSIEGTLYNEDDTEYKPQNSAAKQKPAVPLPCLHRSQSRRCRSSICSTITIVRAYLPPNRTTKTKTERGRKAGSPCGTCRRGTETERKAEPKSAGSPLWQNYTALQSKYPDHILAYRVGDFYEVFGVNAKLLAEPLILRLRAGTADSPSACLWSGSPTMPQLVIFPKPWKTA